MINGRERVKVNTWKIIHLAFIVLPTKELTKDNILIQVSKLIYDLRHNSVELLFIESAVWDI